MRKPTKTANNKQVGGDHYKKMDIQPWDVVDTWPVEQRVGAYRAGALKYLMRMGAKDESGQEIGKGIHYLEKLKELLDSPAYVSPVLGDINHGTASAVGRRTKPVKRGARNGNAKHRK